MTRTGSVRITIPEAIHEKMVAVAKIASPQEVMLLLFSELDENHNIHLTDTYFPYQDAKGGHVEINKKGHIQMPHELGLEKYTNIRGIFHTHGSSSSSGKAVSGGFSGVDEAFLNSIMNKNIPYFVSLLMTTTGIAGRVEIFNPIRASLKGDIIVEGKDSFIDKYREEFSERVNLIKYTPKKLAQSGKVYKGGLQTVFSPRDTDNAIKGFHFTLENPIWDKDGSPICCSNPMAILGARGDRLVLYCRHCYGSVYYPVGDVPDEFSWVRST